MKRRPFFLRRLATDDRVTDAATMRQAVADEIEATARLCRTLGLKQTSISLLKRAHHTTLLVHPLDIVARVQSSEPMQVASRTAHRELAVTRYLAEHGAPVVAPMADAALGGPHLFDNMVVTLWPYIVAARTADDDDATAAACALASVHHQLRGYRCDLPTFTVSLDRCWAVLADDNACQALADQDRTLLRAHYRRLRHEVETWAQPWTPLHGDAHLGNLLVGSDGPRWLDFEEACVGPAEWDIACLPREAWLNFRHADQALLQACADLKSVCVTVWCSADQARSDEMREAADHHLDRIYRLAPESARCGGSA